MLCHSTPNRPAQLHAGGFEAYLVGGCVRDDLRGIEPHDFDFATSAAPEQIAAAFPDTRLLLAGIKHGTVTPLLDGMPVEITSFRRDGPYSDGRRPDHVSFSTQLSDDVAAGILPSMRWHGAAHRAD